MPNQMYRLHDGALLRRLMSQPGSGGMTHTARSLGEAIGVSASKVQKLISGRRPDVTEAVADAIAREVGVNRNALFAPRSFPFMNENTIPEEPMDPVDRTLRARLAAHSSWAKTTDPTSRTAKARTAANNKFMTQARELHPGGSDELIATTAEHLRKAHFARMGLKSAAARRKGTRPEAA